MLTDFTDYTQNSSNALLVLREMKGMCPERYGCGYRLTKGTVIKLGRVRLIVREIHRPEDVSVTREEREQTTRPPEELKENSERECRICRCGEDTAENPLLSPCRCCGSIKYIHANCMKAWYESKLACYHSGHVTSYVVRGLECELCKYKYSLSFEHNGKNFDLISILKPKNVPYIMLESLSAEPYKQIYVATLEPNSSISLVSLT